MFHSHDYIKIRQSWSHLDLESSVWWCLLVRKPWRKGAPAIPFLLRRSFLSSSPPIAGAGGSTTPIRLSFDLCCWLVASSKPLLSPTNSISAQVKEASFLNLTVTLILSCSVAWLLAWLEYLARMMRRLVEVDLITRWSQRKHSEPRERRVWNAPLQMRQEPVWCELAANHAVEVKALSLMSHQLASGVKIS